METFNGQTSQSLLNDLKATTIVENTSRISNGRRAMFLENVSIPTVKFIKINICSDTEFAMANTLFPKVKFGLRKAFFICFEMPTSTKSLSASQTAVRFGVHERTARMFMPKVREAMKSSEDFPMTGVVNVDEYVVGGYEEGKLGNSYDSNKKKQVCAVALTNDGKVKRFYTFQIHDYSAKSLGGMFEKHIDISAKVTTDKQKVYNPIAKDYDLTQILSHKGSNFKALYVTIHQVKSWIRTTYSWVS